MLSALQKAVLLSGTATLGAGVIRSCAAGCMPVFLLGRHQHMGRRWCVRSQPSAKLCIDDCICRIGMYRNTDQTGEKIVVSYLGELSLPPSPVCLPSCHNHCHNQGLCSAVKHCKDKKKALFLLLIKKGLRRRVYYASMCQLLCLSMRELMVVSAAVCMMFDVAQLQVNAL